MTKVYKCEICENPLKDMGNDQFMCDQSLTICSNSLKVTIIKEKPSNES